MNPVGVQPEQGAHDRCARCRFRLGATIGVQPLRRTAGLVLGQHSGLAGAHPVEHQAGQRHGLLVEPFHEVRRLAQSIRLRSRNDEERRLPVLQQRERTLRALAKAAEEGVEGGDERLHVAEHLSPQDAVEGAGDDAKPDGEEPGRAAGGCEQQPDQPPVEQ
jgi:hypothetical protein